MKMEKSVRERPGATKLIITKVGATRKEQKFEFFDFPKKKLYTQWEYLDFIRKRFQLTVVKSSVGHYALSGNLNSLFPVFAI